MKRNLLKFLLLLAIIFLPLSAQNVLACQCRGLSTPYEAYQNADVVFVGKVIGIKNSMGRDISQNKISNWWEDYYRKNEGNTEYNIFAIEELFKGEKKSEVTVSTRINMCQQGFGQGERVLVYAGKLKDEFWTNLFCSRTGWAETDIYFLRELVANKPEPRIYGTVRLIETNPRQETYLKGIKIIAQKGKRKFVTFTDQNGLYRFQTLPDGKYKVYLELTKKYETDWSLTHLEEIILQKNREDIWEYFRSKGPSAYTDFEVRLKK